MNCNKCGSPLAPGAKNCNVCGAEVEPVVNNQSMVNNQVGDLNIAPPSFNLGANNINNQNDNKEETPVFQSSINIPRGPEGANQVTPPNASFDATTTDNSVVQTPTFNTPNLNQEVKVPTFNAQNSLNTDATPSVNPQSTFSVPTPPVQDPNAQVVPNTPVEEQKLGENPASVNYGESNVLVNSIPGEVPQNVVPNVNVVPNQPVINSGNVNTESVNQNNSVPSTTDENQVQTNNVIPTTPEVQSTPVVNEEKPKKKIKLSIIIIVVLIVGVIAFFVFQYISLTNEANKVKNNNANNNLSQKSSNIVSEDAYETIAHQDEYYVEYDFDFNPINDIYEKDYTIGSQSVKISISSDKTGNMSINNVNQKINYPVIKIIHSLKSDTLFIVNELFTTDVDLYVYNGSSFVDMKSTLTNVHHIENFSVIDNTLEFTTSAWKDNIIYNAGSELDLCQGYTQVGETFPIETTYTFDLKQTSYSTDLLNSSTKKEIKELYDSSCQVTEPTTQETPVTNPVVQEPPVEQTPQISTITQ